MIVVWAGRFERPAPRLAALRGARKTYDSAAPLSEGLTREGSVTVPKGFAKSASFTVRGLARS